MAALQTQTLKTRWMPIGRRQGWVVGSCRPQAVPKRRPMGDSSRLATVVQVRNTNYCGYSKQSLSQDFPRKSLLDLKAIKETLIDSQHRPSTCCASRRTSRPRTCACTWHICRASRLGRMFGPLRPCPHALLSSPAVLGNRRLRRGQYELIAKKLKTTKGKAVNSINDHQAIRDGDCEVEVLKLYYTIAGAATVPTRRTDHRWLKQRS